VGTLVLVRHGESRWNVENRFTGWVDIPLSERGIREAGRCAEHCAKFAYSAAFTSRLLRAQETLLVILARQDRTGIFQHTERPPYADWIQRSNRMEDHDLPVFANVVLDERYYGDLQGLRKDEADRTYGAEQVNAWRRGYADRPPNGESLADAHARMLPYFAETILPRAQSGEDVIVVAHGNTLRAAIKHLEDIPDDHIAFVDLPEATPLVYEWHANRFQRVEGSYDFHRPLR
jgi:2,3-bisphosphoglycerate-dependent phosphoglycerate mutase